MASPKNLNGRGSGKRLTKYELNVEPYLEQIENWKAQGMPDNRICENLSISFTQFLKYKETHIELQHALANGADFGIFVMEQKLMEAATGAKEIVEEWQRVYNEDARKWVEVRVKRKVTTKPPSVEALRFFLTNKRAEVWRNRQEQSIQTDDMETMLNGMSDDELAAFDAKLDEEGDDNAD